MSRKTTIVSVLSAFCVVAALTSATPAATSAADILKATGIQGGMVVHLGCGDGKITAALHANNGFLIQGLDADPANVDKARKTIGAAGLYGKVSVSHLSGNALPYIDGLLNLVVAEGLGKVSMDEVMRVLCPNGVAYVKQGGSWTKTVKPRPAEIDDWTHYMHGPDGNPVANDTIVGPPKRLQWVGGPKWARHHEHMASLSALVSAKGRIFYIFDEGSRASIQLPAKWKLIARDAFNGTILWKRDIPVWYTHIYPLKSGPAILPRRLVAVGDRVYLSLGLDKPLVAIDAGTGKTIRTYKDTTSPEEVVFADGVLYLVIDTTPHKKDTFIWDDPVCWTVGNNVLRKRTLGDKKRTVMAINAKSGEVLWSRQTTIAPASLAVKGDRLAYYDSQKIVCLETKTGKPKWTSEQIDKKPKTYPSQYVPALIVCDSVVLFTGGKHQVIAFDSGSGKKLWNRPQHRGGHRSPEDLMVLDGLAWTGDVARTNKWTGYDLRTGEIKKEFDCDIKGYWFHHRCHRSKATTKYFMPSRTGIEYVDRKKEHWIRNHWIRGACIYGVMPANGLTYAPQHPCACYIETKLNGFNAVAPASKTPTPKCLENARLTKGPAYGKVNASKTDATDWPTYRHDAARSGYSRAEVSAEVKPAWSQTIGGRLSSVVVAGGKCFVAQIDAHTVHALDAVTGKSVWKFTANGRVDSPPTIYNGCAIFGSADGYVYCVRASDGELIWRYLAAITDRRHMGFEQIESAWPVHGSVLVRNGEIYCIAGRTIFLDGGMRLCRINAKTGKLISENILNDRDPKTGENFQTLMQGLNMPPGLSDILSSDGKFVYMRSQKFDLKGKRTEFFAGNLSWKESVAQESASKQTGEGVHLFSTAGFLDGSSFHRTYWLYGQMVHNGCNFWFRAAKYAPSGRIMVVDDERVYSYGRLPEHMLWTPSLEYRLYAADKNIKPESIARALEGGKKLQKIGHNRWIFNREITGKMTDQELHAADVKWSQKAPPLIVRGMVLTGKTLFVAGPPDVLDEESAVRKRFAVDVQKQIADQQAAMSGKMGASLWAVSAVDGKRLAELKLSAMPVWDGMAAARGRLYMAATDGKVHCFASDE
ncbi:MAG: PQQ-binding-like beta-propeller repeat protein [Phycisphaerae bacterium]|nr:PQQ-binding-like beta-propeller repeat protein [Phycisphaerae bacterium]